MDLFARFRRAPPPPLDLGVLLGCLLGAEGESPASGRRESRHATPQGLAAEAPERFFEVSDGSIAAPLIAVRVFTETPAFLLTGPEVSHPSLELTALLLGRLLLAGSAAPESAEAEDAAITALEACRTGGPIRISRTASGEGAAASYLFRLGAGRSYRSADCRILAEEAAAALAEEGLRRLGLEAVLDPSVGTAPASEPMDRLRIDRPAELALARFALPLRFNAGGLDAAVFWESLGPGAAEVDSSPAEAPSFLWFRAEGLCPGASAFFSAPAPQANAEAYAARVLAILTAGWGRAALLFGKPAAGAPKPRVSPTAAPPATVLSESLIVEGELRIGTGGFRLRLVLPRPFIALLAAATGTGVATSAGSAIAGAELEALALAANDALLARWGTASWRGLLAPRKSAAARAPDCPSIAAMLDILGSRDATLLLQNCLLPQLGARALPGLFYCLVPAAGASSQEARLLPLEPFPARRVLALLPPLAREEWEHELATAFGGQPWDGEAAVAANEAAARLVHEALRRGRLDLSAPSRALLESELGPRIAEAGRRELLALAAEGIPFGPLAGKSRAALEEILRPFSNRDLALGALGEAGRAGSLGKVLGGGREGAIAEEAEAVGKRLERGELRAEEAAAAKRALRDRIEDRIAALEAERRRAGGPATTRNRRAP